MKKFFYNTINIILGILLIFSITYSPAFSEGAPDLNSLKPGRGGPGTIVTLYGSDLGATRGKSTVMFGSVSAEVVSWSENKILAEVPSDVDPKDLVEVGKGRRKNTLLPVYINVEGAGKTGEKHFDIMPDIKGLSPHQGGPGEKVTVKGFNFGNYIDKGKVFVGTKQVKVLSWTRNSIEIEMPAAVNPEDVKKEEKKRHEKKWVDVYVQAGKVKGEGKAFGWEPEISRVEPSEAGPGSNIEISGRNFGKLISSVKVHFGNKTVKPSSLSENTITAIIPDSISQDDLKDGMLHVSLDVGGVESNSKPISISPELHKIHPDSSHGGVITLKGKKFGKMLDTNEVIFTTTSKLFSGVLKAKILTWSDEEIKVDIPMNLNKTDEDVVFKVKIHSGKFFSNEKDFNYKKVEKKEEKKEEKKDEKKMEEEKKDTEDKDTEG